MAEIAQAEQKLEKVKRQTIFHYFKKKKKTKNKKNLKM